MEDLPLVPTMKIIDYLSIEDVLNLRMVNKWFNQFINENVEIKDLVITPHDHLPANRRWFYTYDLISLQNLFKHDLVQNVCLNLNQPILSQLKQLYINNNIVTLEALNSLDRLIHLEIAYSKIKCLTDNNVLRLPMLEILNLHDPNFDKKVRLDLTNLQALKFYGFYVNLARPESITYLEVYCYEDCKNFLPSCFSLQHLFCYNLNQVDLNEFNLIKHLSKLKSIHFGESRKTFDSLVKEKKRFNQDLKIYFQNLELDELPVGLDDFHLGVCLNENLIQYYLEYYSRLADHCPFVDSVYYHDLERCFGQIPENFMKRFVNLKHFIAHKEVNNLDQLIRVLGECKTITRLVLPSSLGQHFFDFHLYDLCPNIDELEIFGERVLNCEFILKFKYIWNFFVNQIESIEFVRRFVESPEYINVKFNYFHNRDLFEIKISKLQEIMNIEIKIIKRNEEDPLILYSFHDLYELESFFNDF